MSYQKMKRFPCVGIFTQPGSVSMYQCIRMLDGFCSTCYARGRHCWKCKQLAELRLFFLQTGSAWKMSRGRVQSKNDEEIFIKMLTQDAICGMIAMAWTMMCCGDADAAAEAPPRLTSSPNLASFVWSGGWILSSREKEGGDSWRTRFPGVASVVKVIWFRFRISAARELLSSTRPGFVRTHHACTTSRSVTEISSSMNPSVMGHFTRIVVAAHKCQALWSVNVKWEAKGKTFFLLPFTLSKRSHCWRAQ